MIIVDNDMKEDLDYSSLLDSLNSNLSEVALSLEDIAWADSCLSKDVGSSNTEWNSVKDALLEILISPQAPPSSAMAESSGQPTSTNDAILQFRENVDEDLINDDDVGEVKSIELSEDDEEDFMNKHGRVKGKTSVANVFLPNYREDMVAVQKLDSGLDMGLTTYEVEPSSEDIFKVWDLGICDELDDFTKQMNKALSEIPHQNQSTDDDSTSWKDSMNVSVDDLIAGFGGLSLVQITK